MAARITYDFFCEMESDMPTENDFIGFAFESDGTFEAYGFHAIFFSRGKIDDLEETGWENDYGFRMLKLPLEEARTRADELSTKLRLPVFVMDGDACVAQQEGQQ